MLVRTPNYVSNKITSSLNYGGYHTLTQFDFRDIKGGSALGK